MRFNQWTLMQRRNLMRHQSCWTQRRVLTHQRWRQSMTVSSELETERRSDHSIESEISPSSHSSNNLTEKISLKISQESMQGDLNQIYNSLISFPRIKSWAGKLIWINSAPGKHCSSKKMKRIPSIHQTTTWNLQKVRLWYLLDAGRSPHSTRNLISQGRSKVR